MTNRRELRQHGTRYLLKGETRVYLVTHRRGDLRIPISRRALLCQDAIAVHSQP